MKKIIALLICFIMLFSLTGVCAYADELIVKTMRVDLVGKTVTLDDEPLAVSQAPYINSNGDTMIELKVLVNALGAELTETEGTFSVTLDGVEMLYTLDSAQVQIGTQTITMNSPVIMADGGVVMAPLRFVAEALGADVTYNGELKEVVIVSAGGFDEAASLKLLFKYSGKNKIGHSEEHWRFIKPDNFDMPESYYDGWYDFALGDIMLSFVVTEKSEISSLEQYYIYMQEISSYDKKVMYDKGKSTHNGVPYVYAKFRTLDTINERYAYETDEFFYLIDLERTFESFAAAKENADVNAFLESLEFDYNGGEEDVTVDLAKIDLTEESSEEKKTEYVDGNYSWSIKLNDTWEVEEYYGFFNKVSIQRPSEIEDEESGYSDIYYGSSYTTDPMITITTYSSLEGKTTTQWANEKHALYQDTYNSEVYNISAVQDVKVGNYQAKCFEVRYAEGEDHYVEKLYYLDDGSYRYEIFLSYDQREEENETFLNSADSVIQSFTPGTINATEVGEALESDSETELIDVFTEFKGELFTVSYPCVWIVEESDAGLYISKSGSYTDLLSAELLSIISPELSFLYGISDDVSAQVVTESLHYYDDEMNQQTYSVEAYMKKNVAQILNTSSTLFTVTMPTEIQEATLMGLKGYRVDLVIEVEGEKMYYTTYYLPYQEDHVITVTKTCSGTSKNTIYEKALDKAINSLKFS